MTNADGVLATLKELLGQGRTFVELAQVVAPPTPNPAGANAAPLVDLLLQPGGAPCEARVAHLGVGVGKGLFPRLQPGDTVIVLFPGGERNNAVVLGSLATVAAGLTGQAVVSQRTLVQDAAGVELRSADGLPADGVVLGAFLQALMGYVAAIKAFMAVAATPGAPASYVAAVNAAAAQFNLDTADFEAALAASAGFVDPATGGVGGPPFASALIRATT